MCRGRAHVLSMKPADAARRTEEAIRAEALRAVGVASREEAEARRALS